MRPFGFIPSRHRAAMRWRDGLGSSLLRECSRTFCNLSVVSADSTAIPGSFSFFDIFHFVPAASTSTSSPHPSWLRWGSEVVVVVVVGFLGWRFVFLFCPALSFRSELRDCPSLFVASRLVYAASHFFSFSLQPFKSSLWSSLLSSSLTLKRTASGQTEALRIYQSPT